MDKEDSDISKLIALKKYEQPEEGFFSDVLADFQQRQESPVVKPSLLECVSSYFKFEVTHQKVAFCATLAVIFTIGVFMLQQEGVENQNTAMLQSPETEDSLLVASDSAFPQEDIQFVFVDLSETISSYDSEF